MRDIGERVTWPELRRFVEHLPPSGDSALFREKFPQSWWWTPEITMMSQIVWAIQVGNWQRAGGKGRKPELLEKPTEKPKTPQGWSPTSGEELAGRRQQVKDELERRRKVARGN